MKIQKLVFGVGVVLLSSCAYGAQILSNPDFETGVVAPWLNDNSVQSGSWAITTVGCHTGVYCVTESGDVGLYQTFGVNTSTITAANFWVKPTNGIVIALFYQGLVTPDYIMFNPTVGQLNVWDNVNLLASLRSSATLTEIDVFGYSGGVTMLDDFNVDGTVPEPGAFWLLGAGLGMVGGLARAKKARSRS